MLSENDEIINDFVLPDLENDIGKQHAIIKFSQIKRKYRIKDLSQGTGTFAKVQDPVMLKTSNIVSFADSHMLIKCLENSNI